MSTYFAAHFDGKYHILRWYKDEQVILPENPPAKKIIQPDCNYQVKIYTSIQGLEFVEKMLELLPDERFDYKFSRVYTVTQERLRKCEYYAMVFNLRHIYGTEFPVIRPDLFEAYYEALKNRGDKFIIVSDNIIHTDRALVARFNNHIRFIGNKEGLILSDNPPKINGKPIPISEVLKFWTSTKMPLSDILDKQFAQGEAYIWGFIQNHTPMDIIDMFTNDSSYWHLKCSNIDLRNEWLYYLLNSQSSLKPKIPVQKKTEKLLVNCFSTTEAGFEYVKEKVTLQDDETITLRGNTMITKMFNADQVRNYNKAYKMLYLYGTEKPIIRSDLFEAYHEALKNRGDKFIIVSDNIIHTDRALVARFNNHVRFLGDKEGLVLSDKPPKLEKQPMKIASIGKFWSRVLIPLSEICDEQYDKDQRSIWGLESGHQYINDLNIVYEEMEGGYCYLSNHCKSDVYEWIYYLLESQKMTQ